MGPWPGRAPRYCAAPWLMATGSERNHPLALDGRIDHLAPARALADVRGQGRALEVFFLGLAAAAGAQHLDGAGAGGHGDERILAVDVHQRQALAAVGL